MTRNTPPDYYAILEVTEKASAAQIRDAYKRAALKTHPDRVANNSPERAQRTRRFQLVNDAYYTLSDPTRRAEYDIQRTSYRRPTASDPFQESEDTSGQSFYSWAWDHFANGAGREEAENAQFSDAFEEMMRDEGFAPDGTPNQQQQGTSTMWGMVGAVSGGALGFIVGNVPGLLAGAVAGNRLGAIRDTKGKSVYQVFQELPSDDKARLLSQLAARVFSHVTG
ncbi:DnaJ domain-containing protein [Trichoderma novae-zelandiae]